MCLLYLAIQLYYGSTNIDKAEGGERIKPACIGASDKLATSGTLAKGVFLNYLTIRLNDLLAPA
jgi:hypothetical protein